MEHETLFTFENPEITKLVNLYKEDKYIARVIFMNNKKIYSRFELKLFKYGKFKYNLILFRKTYGISKTNKMFSHEKKMLQLNVSPKKYYIVNNGKIHLLTPHSLMLHTTTLSEVFEIDSLLKNKISEYFYTKHKRFEFLKNRKISLSFNSITTKKLFSNKKIDTEIYGFNKTIRNIIKSSNYTYNFEHHLKNYSEYIIKSDIVNKDLFDDRDICSKTYDTIKMSKTLDLMVNLNWSKKRMIIEHDKRSKMLTKIIMTYDSRDLNINKHFKKLNELFDDKITLITNTKDLANEGQRLNHCVASYASKVDSGSVAIFTMENSTIEIGINSENFIILQHRGQHNCSPPNKEIEELGEQLKRITKTHSLKFKECSNLHINELPF